MRHSPGFGARVVGAVGHDFYDQHEAGAAAGQLTGEVGAEPAGRSRDQRVPSLQGGAAHDPLLSSRIKFASGGYVPSA